MQVPSSRALQDLGVGPLSPEARAAAAAYREVADELPEMLHDCAGGRELIQYGFPQDVAVAAKVGGQLGPFRCCGLGPS